MEYSIKRSPAILSSVDIAEICSPLNHFDLLHFNYRRTYADGSRALLTNDPNWLTHYYDAGYANHGTFENIDEIQSGYVLWQALENNATFANIFADARNNFNIDNGLTIIKKQFNYVEFFHFGATRDNHAAVNRCLENLDGLEKFILYFRDKAAKLLACATETKLHSPIKPILLDAKQGDACITHQHRYLFNKTIWLSRQETFCLFFYLRGKTIKNIAEIMRISARTIEEYINNIKKKTGLNTKYDFFNHAEKFVLLNTMQNQIITNDAQNYSVDASICFNQLPIKKYFLSTVSGDIYLSKRQAQCLFNAIQGKRIKEIARLLNLSARTIEDNLRAIRQKLSCRNKNDLIATLFDQQLIAEIKRWHFT